MASIRKRGNSYLLVVSAGYDHKGKRRKPWQKTVKPPDGLTAKQEEKWLNEQSVLFEQEVKNQKPATDPKMTLGRFVEQWLETTAPKKLAVSTLVREKQDIERFLPHLGHLKLTEINKEILRKFYDTMRETPGKKTGKLLSEKTVEGIHACLCGILSDAVEAGYLEMNPAWGAYKRKGKKKEIFAADRELATKLIECLEQESLKYELYFKLVLFTGMRRGETTGLKWKDVDWKKKTLKAERTIVKVAHHEILAKEPKTSAGQRVVYLSDQLIKLLKDFRRYCRHFVQQFMDRDLETEDFIFIRDTGQPMTPNTFTFRFNKILSKYGLPKELTVHSLRHTCASLMVSENVDVRTVASLLGHAQPSTTLDIYSHAFDKTKKEASEKLQKALNL